MKSMVFADPFLLLKMRLQSDTVTIRPATSNIVTAVSKFAIQFLALSREYFPLLFFFFLNYLYTSRLLSFFSCHWVANTLTGAGFVLLTVLKHQNNQNAESSVK